MKAVILAGGSGTRLYPVTNSTNKHLLPVYDKPMIVHGIEKLAASGIADIMVVSTPEHIAAFAGLLDSRQSQVRITYGTQNKPAGIAQGLFQAKDFVGGDSCALYLGDNIFEDDLTPHIRDFGGSGARIFVKKAVDPHGFGLATIDSKNNVVKVCEKPAVPDSDLAITGFYLFDGTVFDKMINQPKSDRGEYEITYIIDLYLKEGKLKATKLGGAWFDAGTFDGLRQASNFVKQKINPHEI
jgi:glucose-1-phosphate thymidylyltransferase